VKGTEPTVLGCETGAEGRTEERNNNDERENKRKAIMKESKREVKA
jgi:hypothetical protein